MPNGKHILLNMKLLTNGFENHLIMSTGTGYAMVILSVRACIFISRTNGVCACSYLSPFDPSFRANDPCGAAVWKSPFLSLNRGFNGDNFFVCALD